MSSSSPASAIGVICDDANRIQHVLRSPAGLKVGPGRALVTLFHPGSREKAMRLVETIRTEGRTAEWELQIGDRQDAPLLNFCGTRCSAGTLVVGCEDSLESTALLGLCLRELGESETVLPAPSGPRKSAGLYEQIAALNNQLVTTQRELEKKNAEMQRLLEDRAQIAAMAAHDLRTPLQVIISCVTLLGSIVEPRGAGNVGKALGMVRRSADNMLALVNDLLFAYSSDIGRLELTMQSVDLEVLVRCNAENNRTLSEQKKITLLDSVEGRIPPVLADAARLDQVLNNLVHNAIKFSPAGSTIRVRLSTSNDSALIEIADEGIGIETTKLQSMLDGAAIASRPGTGSERGYGLGLHIVRSIVEKSGGTLDAHSQPGHGTRFTIRLPACNA